MSFKVSGNVPAEKLRQLVERSRDRSAVYDIITNSVPVSIESRRRLKRDREPIPMLAPPHPIGLTAVSASTSRRRDLLAGARAMAPWLVGIAPYGLVIGMSAASADMPTVAGWLTGPLLYSGSSQVALIELVDAGAAPVVAVLAVLAINLRLVLYSATMAPYWHGMSRRWRALAAALLVDPSLAVGVDGYAATSGDVARGHRRYMGGALLLCVTWLMAIAVGAVAGGLVPAGLRLEFVIPLFLAGEVIKRMRGRAATRAAVVASVVAVAAVSMPLHLGPVAAMVAGVLVGLVTTERTS